MSFKHCKYMYTRRTGSQHTFSKKNTFGAPWNKKMLFYIFECYLNEVVCTFVSIFCNFVKFSFHLGTGTSRYIVKCKLTASSTMMATVHQGELCAAGLTHGHPLIRHIDGGLITQAQPAGRQLVQRRQLMISWLEGGLAVPPVLHRAVDSVQPVVPLIQISAHVF